MNMSLVYTFFHITSQYEKNDLSIDQCIFYNNTYHYTIVSNTHITKYTSKLIYILHIVRISYSLLPLKKSVNY